MKLWFVIYGNENEKDVVLDILTKKDLKYQIDKIDAKSLGVDVSDETGVIWFSDMNDETLNEINKVLFGIRLL